MYEILIILILINLGFTYYIWRMVKRGPKRKFLAKLLNGKPITPKHTPSSLRNGIELRITDEDQRFLSEPRSPGTIAATACRFPRSSRKATSA